MFRLCLAAFLVGCVVCAAQEQGTPTFSSTTTLVEFTVVALDKKGNPVTDLKQEDFSVAENGKNRDIALFRFEGATDESQPSRSLAAGTFSNRAEVAPGPPRNVTAILLDTLNTPAKDQIRVRAQVMRYLQALAPDTRVAFYGLGQDLKVLHDFTDDTESLRERLNKIQIGFEMQREANVSDLIRDAERLIDTVPPERRGAMGQLLSRQIESAQNFNKAQREDRMQRTLAALEALGDHLEGIPGRKSLVWISGGIYMLSVTGSIGAGTSTRGQMGYQQIKSYEDWIRATAQRLAHQGITMYMVDTRGLTGPGPNEEDSNALGPIRGRQRTFGGYQQSAQLSNDPLPAMYEMAEATGGRVVTNWNDATQGMKEVASDLRGTYSLGFYAVDEPDGKWRRLNLKVKRKDVKLAYRKGYLSEVVADAPLEWSEDEWRTAIYNPLGSTALRLDAHCEKAVGEGAGTTLRLVVNIPAEDLYFRETAGQHEAEVEVAVVEKTAAGGVHIRREPTKFTLDAAQAAKVGDAMLVYTDAWPPKPGIATIRLIVRDKFTGRYGMLDMPVDKIPVASAAN